MYNTEKFSVMFHELTHATFRTLQGYEDKDILISYRTAEGLEEGELVFGGSCGITESFTTDIQMDNQYFELNAMSSLSGIINTSSECVLAEGLDNYKDFLKLISKCETTAEDEAAGYIYFEGYGQTDWKNYITACEGTTDLLEKDIMKTAKLMLCFLDEIANLATVWYKLDEHSIETHDTPITITSLQLLRNILEGKSIK